MEFFPHYSAFSVTVVLFSTMVLTLPVWCHQPVPILTGKLDQKPAAAIAETDCVWDCNFSAKFFIYDADNGLQRIGKKLVINCLWWLQKDSENITKPPILCQTWSGQ